MITAEGLSQIRVLFRAGNLSLYERKDHIPHGCWEWCLNED